MLNYEWIPLSLIVDKRLLPDPYLLLENFTVDDSQKKEQVSDSAADESGTTEKKQIDKALQLYKVKHPKKCSFTFMSVWLIVKEIPRWEQPRDEKRTPTMKLKRKAVTQDIELLPESPEIEVLGDGKKQPPGNKAAKEDQKQIKHRESSMRAQAKATFDLVDITKKKLELMEDQNMQAIFSVRDSYLDSDEARQFFALRSSEMLHKLKARLDFDANTAIQSPSTVVRTHEETNQIEEDQIFKNRHRVSRNTIHRICIQFLFT
ncbi:hypothetical protein R1sor_001540 [Riccia sorocarpa]|uniref:No apical meristem-associated C-terminal domain-containing protein n=1 Tax=Riccia sorocarpa TaxID=122646 RepID=A0ABD3GWJ9_9MARC